MKLYLAGPMRTEPHLNFPLFLWAALSLRMRGHEVVSPAELDVVEGRVEWDLARMTLNAPCVVDNTPDRAAVLQRAVSAALSCEGMALLPGWEKSHGCSVEIASVLDYGAPSYRFFLLDENLIMNEVNHAYVQQRCDAR